MKPKPSAKQPRLADWAESHTGEWRMYWDIKNEKELDPALVWEFARSHGEFLKAAAKREFYLNAEPLIEDLAFKRINEPESFTLADAQQLAELSSQLENERLPDALSHAPIRGIWSSPHFPQTPWLALPEEAKRELMNELTRPAPVGFQPLSVMDTPTFHFVEEIKAQQTELGKLLPENFDVSESVESPPAMTHEQWSDHQRTDALIRHDWRVTDRELGKMYMRWLKENRPHKAAPRPVKTAHSQKIRALLLGLALDRFKQNCGGSWKEIHKVIDPTGKAGPLTPQKKGKEYIYPAHARSRKKALAFKKRLIEELTERYPYQLGQLNAG